MTRLPQAEELADHHDITDFTCGNGYLDTWLTSQAHRAARSGTAKTYVLTASDGVQVVGYYAIAPHQVRRDELPASLSGGVAVIPGYLLGKLAVDLHHHGQGIGSLLLYDALQRIVAAAQVASGRLVIVDAIDDKTAAFYLYHGFTAVRNNPHRLVLKIATITNAFHNKNQHP